MMPRWIESRRALQIWILATILAAASVAVYFAGVKDLPGLASPFRIPWPILAVAFSLAEVSVIHMHFRRDAHSFSLNEIPLIIGLFFIAPADLILAQAVGSALALAIHRRQSPLKLAFNVAHFTLGGGLATLLFHTLITQAAAGSIELGVAILAAFLSSAVSVVAIFGAISISEGGLELSRLWEMLGLIVIGVATNTSLAVVGVTMLWHEPTAGWLLLFPSTMIFLAYRAYSSQKDKHDSLQFLYSSSRLLHQSPEVDAAVLALLDEARLTFRAESAEMTLFPSTPGQPALRTRVGDGIETVVMEAVEDAIPELHQAVDQRPATLITGRETDHDLRSYLDSRQMHDAMIAPLLGETRTIGAFVLANRLGDVTSFDAGDLQLFETLANHASVALENGRLEKSLIQLTELKEQLRHQAFHDSLTLLANRTLFSDRVEEALARPERTQGSIAVLFLDLDDFKTINDSLGHDVGDKLLVAVADRLRDCLRPQDLAARLGGDEFAVLLDDVTDPSMPVQVAERIISVMRSPFLLQDTEVFVHTSVGIAVDSRDEHSAGDLLRNADVAMYQAKTEAKGRYAMFETSMRAAAQARLTLKAELQRAVADNEFVVHYQPIIDFQTGEISAMEALVRWQHPERGLVAPQVFLGLAKETGLLRIIGSTVLHDACAQARVWNERFTGHTPIAIHVNLWARQLQDRGLVEELASALDEYDLAPSQLVLEITESDVLYDANVGKLRRLKRLGIQLAVDDFGTGYSSLSYLQRFPLDILKIPKPFVDPITGNPEDTVLARAIIEMGRALKLSTIAEGVENRIQRDVLKGWGCDYAQGYLFAYPVPAEEAEDLLAQQFLGEEAGRVIQFPA